MTHHQQSPRPHPALLPIFLWLLLVAATTVVFAHDPGLSAVDLRFTGGRLQAELAFARPDIEPLVKLDADLDSKVSTQELAAARPQLEALARTALAINIDGQPLAPNAISVTTDDSSNAVHFKLTFPAATGSWLQLHSRLFEKLALGHKQFLSLRGANDETLGARMLDATNNTYELSLTALATQERSQSFWYFLKLGIEHILTGFDHLAFLLALLLTGGTLRTAAKIITSFTVAHSITLALATLNVVNLPSNIVEPLIAVSIIYVGLENIFRREIKRRWLLTFAFGLIHGFGFATVLRELGIGAHGGALVPLLSFNLGVELGQIAIAALVLPLIWKLQQRPAFVLRYVPACSILVALAGGYWLLARTLLK